jgi:hypothetical protein
VPQPIRLVADLIAGRFDDFIGQLRREVIVAKDFFGRPVKGAFWYPPRLAINVETGTVWEIPNIEKWQIGYNESENKPLLEGNRLYISFVDSPPREEADTRKRPGGNELRKRKPTGSNKSSPRRIPRTDSGRIKVSVVCSTSIKSAMKDLGWRHPPKGILVEQRDNLISERQRKLGLKVTSPKTNQRFFSSPKK